MTEAGITSALLLEVPPGLPLTAEQVTGTVCVWCVAPLTDDARVDLGGRGTFRPHSCARCHQALTDMHTIRAQWYEHCESCETCRADARCVYADVLRLHYAEVRQTAGRQPMMCLSCGQEMTWAERCRPVNAIGFSRPLRGFAHIVACPQPKPRRASA